MQSTQFYKRLYDSLASEASLQRGDGWNFVLPRLPYVRHVCHTREVDTT